MKLAAFWRGGKARNVPRKSHDDRLRGQDQVRLGEVPVPVRVRGRVRPLERIGAQVEELRHAQRDERLRPQLEGSARPLLHEDELPVVEPQRDEIAVVREVDEALARADVLLPGEVREQVEAVDVHLEGLAGRFVALLQLVDDVRLAGGREERGQPVVVLDDLVGDDARRDLPGPAHDQRHAEGALPVRVLLAPERGHRAVRPRVHVRPVVGGVHDDRVLGDPEPIEQVEELADVAVVVDHRVVVGRLPPAGLAEAPALRVGAEVHVREVHPAEERLPPVVLALDEVAGGVGELVVAGLHPLPGQRARVLDPLLADASPARVLLRVVLRPSPCSGARRAGRSARGTPRSRASTGSPGPPGPPPRSGGRGCRRTRRSRAPSGGTRSCPRGGSCRTGPSRSRGSSGARRSWGPRLAARPARSAARPC